MMGNRRLTMMAGLIAVAPWAAGCAESVTMIGNGLSMVVACALLWSTVNLGKPGDEDR